MAAVGAALRQYPEQREVLATAADLYSVGGQFDSELGIIEDMLKREPEQVELLARRGVAELHASKYERAIATLTKAL
jgi:Flp pilus assembly protein TadD